MSESLGRAWREAYNGIEMSEQIVHTSIPAAHLIWVHSHLSSRSQAILVQLPALGVHQPTQLQVYDLYFIQGDLSIDDMERLAALICDPVTDHYGWRKLEDRVASFPSRVIDVALRPGVTDNVAMQLQRAARQVGISGITAVATGQRYEWSGELSESELHRIARSLLVNNTIQRYTLGDITPEFVHSLPPVTRAEKIEMADLDEAGLVALSRERRLALDVEEMRAIQVYFQRAGRPPTDAELETLAQTWSEHCVHKTFKARLRLPDGSEINGLLRETLQAATQAIDAPWVRSAFVDNAGIIAFDDRWDISFKVETHNHPSAIEPFGGANTGVGGVVRDNLGVSHRPIAVTDVLCFGPADQPFDALPEGVLHPTRIRHGVVTGVGDYGNKLGLATVNGAVLYHPGYTANPLVYCGSVGIGPRDCYPRHPQPGDRVIVIGGRTGRDGLRGATFSSLTMDAQTGQVAGASVQIGDPITEKGVIEVVVRARDAGLYHAITDCGAGGLSSAVGEMSAGLGARVDLRCVPLKYAGLAPWEIWLSEAQERMVLAVPVESLPALVRLCETYQVEWSDIGEFLPTGRLEVVYAGEPVVALDNDFLHHGRPQLVLDALPPGRPAAHPDTCPKLAWGKEPAPSNLRGVDYNDLLLALLSHPNIASKEKVVRRYDYEVRGATVVKPFAGCAQEGPSDAAVLKPLETEGWRGFVLANGINPWYGEIDPYAMAFSAVDEAIRNAVAVGGDPQRLALLDNFCWGDPRRPETLGSLVRAAQGCHDAAIYYGTPFISGKDSLNNEYLGADGQRHAIPGTLLISSIAIHPDVRRATTMDLKTAGNLLYLVGDFQPTLAGSHSALAAPHDFVAGLARAGEPPGRPEHAPLIYRLLHQAILAGWVRSAHDLSEGGLAVSAAEMVLAGRVGLSLDLAPPPWEPVVELFGETNGCLLVEVTPEASQDFERRFQAAQISGKPACRRVGMVTPGQAFEVSMVGEALIDLPVPDLLRAFLSPGKVGFPDESDSEANCFI